MFATIRMSSTTLLCCSSGMIVTKCPVPKDDLVSAIMGCEINRHLFEATLNYS